MTVIGTGAADADLSAADLREIVARGLDAVPAGARVLAVIPDKTRDDPTSVLFPFAAAVLAARGAARLDALVAQGTHSPMTDAEKRAKIGTTDGRELALPARVFDHRWDRAEELETVGALPADLVRHLSGGVLDEEIPVRLNRLVATDLYDAIVIFGATTPHEVAGFSGGAKYLFPGVAGPDLTHKTHWLGALLSVERIIGRVETPTRHLIEAAADFVRPPVVSLNAVVTRDGDRLRTHALFAGDVRAAVRSAARVSARVHVRYTGRTYRRVIALLDEHYTDMWVGGKASYRLGAVVEEGGELVIYAPHLDRLSETHGALIERYGYAPIEVVREWVATSPELADNLCVAAHLAHVAYSARRDHDGRLVPKFRITLASRVDRATCELANLGYADPRAFDAGACERDADTLVVERAGRDLYLVAPAGDDEA